MAEKIYLVPHDFSKVADNAVKQAVFIANKANATVMLLHIVEKASSIPTAKQKLQLHVDQSNFGAIKPIQLEVLDGNIFKDIADTAKKYHAHVIVMGTHGAKGMQKVFGSFAIKVITSTETPFIIVQDEVATDKTNSIVAPLDETSESLQIIPTTMEFAQAFDSKIHLIIEKDIYAGYKTKIKTRLQLLAEKFERYGIKYEFKTVGGSGSYSDKVLEYTKKNDIDYIAVSYFSDSLLPQFDKYTQNLITNKFKKPVLVIKAKESSNAYF